jgi:hypothetical protein
MENHINKKRTIFQRAVLVLLSELMTIRGTAKKPKMPKTHTIMKPTSPEGENKREKASRTAKTIGPKSIA